MGLELEKGFQLFFFKFFEAKLLFILFLCFFLFFFLRCVLNSDAPRTFVILQFVCPTTKRLLNLVKE